MPIERFFCDVHFLPNETCALEDFQEFHHLTNVIRCRVNDEVELVNGKNQLATAKIVALEKKRALFHIFVVTEKQPEKQLILAQAIPRFPRLEWILEKGTELGASAFWLFPGEWSEKTTFSESQFQRMRLITIAAMKQCGRLDLPPILLKPPVKEWQTLELPLFYGDTRPSAQSLHPPLPSSAILIVGPERGLSPQELSLLDTRHHAHPAHLNANILRTDTAALAFLALFSGF